MNLKKIHLHLLLKNKGILKKEKAFEIFKCLFYCVGFFNTQLKPLCLLLLFHSALH